MVGAPELALMRPHAYLINTSRGPIVDEAALIAALQTGRIAGAGIDVFDVEPPDPEHPLRRLRNVTLSPHLGYVTRETLAAFYGESIEAVLAWLTGHRFDRQPGGGRLELGEPRLSPMHRGAVGVALAQHRRVAAGPASGADQEPERTVGPAGRLHRHVGERRGGVGPGAQRVHPDTHAAALLLGQVLPGDRVPQHRQGAVGQSHAGDRVGRRLPHQLRRYRAGDGDRAAQSR